MVNENKVLGLIPARGGSKGIPRKNIKLLNDLPLISYSIASGLESDYITRLVVSTDDEEIAKISKNYGAEVPFLRPKELAKDDSLDFPVIEHSLNWLEQNEGYIPDFVVQLRPTSPLRPKGLIDRAINLIINDINADSIRSVTHPYENPYKMWKKNDKYLSPLIDSTLNEPYNMPRQDLPVSYWQTGHIDVIKLDTIKQKKSLSGDKILPIIIESEFCIDIDNEEDLKMAESVFKSLEGYFDSHNESFKNKLKTIKLLVFDFDGVFTNNKVILDENGIEHVICDRGDGLGLNMLKKIDLDIIILSTETNKVVSSRAKKLKIDAFQSIKRKLDFLKDFCEKKQIGLENVAYVGNDLNDLDCMENVGLSICPSDSFKDVKNSADVVLENKGGDGAIRELCDLIIKKW